MTLQSALRKTLKDFAYKYETHSIERDRAAILNEAAQSIIQSIRNQLPEKRLKASDDIEKYYNMGFNEVIDLMEKELSNDPT